MENVKSKNKKVAVAFISIILVAAVFCFQLPSTTAAPQFTAKDTMIQQWITLCDAHPSYASYEAVGGYYEGGTIYVFRIGNPSSTGVVLIDGEMHGWEDIGSEIMYLFAVWLLTDDSEESNRILAGNYFLFMPVVTRAGYYDGVTPERGNYNLTNGKTYGVDINRNFVTGWTYLSGAGTPSAPSHGSAAADQNETRAVRYVMANYNPKIYVNTHYGGGPWLNSYGTNTTLSSWIKTRTNQLNVASFSESFSWSLGSGSVGNGMAVGDANAYGANSWLWEVAANNGSPYATGTGSDAYMHNVQTMDDIVNWYFPHSLPFLMAIAEAVENTTATPTQYALTVSASTGGSMTPSVGEHLLNEGTNQTLIASPSTGYDFAGVWSIDSSNVSASSQYYIIMNANHTVYPYFVLEPEPGEPSDYLIVSVNNVPTNQIGKVNGVSVNVTNIYGNNLRPLSTPTPTPRPEDWMETYNNRVPFVVTDAKISANLTNFPVLLSITSTAGTNDTDLTPVFTNLTTSSLKWAITEDDGVTEVTKGEVELWDNANSKAYLWASLNLTDGQDNVFYLYYDSTAADNVLVGGDPNAAAANNVWDANYTLVHHLQGASYTALDDSTGFNHDVSSATNTPGYNVVGKIGNGLHEDVGDDIIVSDDPHLDGFSEFTMEIWVSVEALPASSGRRAFVGKYTTGDNQRSYSLTLFNDGGTYKLQLYLSTSGTSGTLNSVNWTPEVATWYSVAVRWDSAEVSTPVLYINGTATSWTTSAAVSSAVFAGSADLNFGLGFDSSSHRGELDEIRISDVDRGDAYVTANYDNQIDNLIAWGASETI